MPSESRPQHNLMEGIEHGWKPSGMPGKKLPPVSVARDFVAADKASGKFRKHVGPIKQHFMARRAGRGR